MKWILILIVAQHYQYNVVKIDEYSLEDQCKTYGEFLILNIKMTDIHKQYGKKIEYICLPSMNK